MSTRTLACPALLVAAPSSDQGKTTVVAALARLHARRGRRVRVFKCGPDFLDPQILAAASGSPVYNLDLWMCGERDAQGRLADAAAESDLILVEGVMGLYDGSPCAADIARRFRLPVLLVIDGAKIAQTFGALVLGLTQYGRDLSFFGVLANRVGSAGHADMLRQSLPSGVRWLGHLTRDTHAELPRRHLGLVQAAEVGDLLARIDRAADAVEATGAGSMPPSVEFGVPGLAAATSDRHAPATMVQARPLDGKTIAVARDAAFSFLYPANLDCLESLGARLEFFSPCSDRVLPRCDALWLPGGYPELHLAELAANSAMKDAVRAHHAQGKPTLAECGGMLYLLQSLRDRGGDDTALAGVLPGQAATQPRFAALGLQHAELPEGPLRGHTFHYSRMETTCAPIANARCPNGGAASEPVYRLNRLTASYMHFYFPSNPAATARLFLP